MATATNLPSQFEPLLTASEVAEILRVSRTQAYRLLATGELPSLHFGGKTVRVRRTDLERFIGRQPDIKQELSTPTLTTIELREADPRA